VAIAGEPPALPPPCHLGIGSRAPMAAPAEIAANAATAIAVREPQMAGTLTPRGRTAREIGSGKRNPISSPALGSNSLILFVGVAAAGAAAARGKLEKPPKTAPDPAESALIRRDATPQNQGSALSA
jgi:hypothetical protein